MDVVAVKNGMLGYFLAYRTTDGIILPIDDEEDINRLMKIVNTKDKMNLAAPSTLSSDRGSGNDAERLYDQMLDIARRHVGAYSTTVDVRAFGEETLEILHVIAGALSGRLANK